MATDGDQRAGRRDDSTGIRAGNHDNPTDAAAGGARVGDLERATQRPDDEAITGQSPACTALELIQAALGALVRLGGRFGARNQRDFVIWWDGQEKAQGARGTPGPGRGNKTASQNGDAVSIENYGLDRMTVHRWRQRLGGYVRMSIEERREAFKELTDEGLSQRDVAEVIGVSQKTVDRDLESFDSEGDQEAVSTEVAKAGRESNDSEPTEPTIAAKRKAGEDQRKAILEAPGDSCRQRRRCDPRGQFGHLLQVPREPSRRHVRNLRAWAICPRTASARSARHWRRRRRVRRKMLPAAGK